MPPNPICFPKYSSGILQSPSQSPQELLVPFGVGQDNARLHANLLEMEFGADVGQNEGNTMSCFERALRSPLPDEAKLLFSQRRVEFLEDFGSSIHRWGGNGAGGFPKMGLQAPPGT